MPSKQNSNIDSWLELWYTIGVRRALPLFLYTCRVEHSPNCGDVTDSTGVLELELRVGGIGSVRNVKPIITGKQEQNLAFAA